MLHTCNIAAADTFANACVHVSCEQLPGKTIQSASSIMCLTYYMLLCSYYINPLAWTLYGIIVTQLGDETDVVSSSVKCVAFADTFTCTLTLAGCCCCSVLQGSLLFLCLMYVPVASSACSVACLLC